MWIDDEPGQLSRFQAQRDPRLELTLCGTVAEAESVAERIGAIDLVVSDVVAADGGGHLVALVESSLAGRPLLLVSDMARDARLAWPGPMCSASSDLLTYPVETVCNVLMSCATELASGIAQPCRSVLRLLAHDAKLALGMLVDATEVPHDRMSAGVRPFAAAADLRRLLDVLRSQ